MSRIALFFVAAAALAALAIAIGTPSLRPNADPHPIAVAPPDAAPSTAPSNGSLKLQARLSHPVLSPGKNLDVFMSIDLGAVEIPGADRSPVNLALVIDRSGSMHGHKIEQAKSAARHLVSQLTEKDRLTVIQYGSDVRSFPATQATPGNREKMVQFIDEIRDEGGTNIGAALLAASDHLARSQSEFKVSRAILISDGQPTEGVVDDGRLVQMAREMRTRGISVSAIGVGTDFNEDLMQALAEFGSGSYGYLRDASALSSLFQKDLRQAGTEVARDVSVSIDLPPGVEMGEALGHRSSQSGRTVRIPMPDFAAGQSERVVVRLEVQAPDTGGTFRIADVKAQYADRVQSGPAELAVALSARVSKDQQEVLSRRDPEALVFAARARTGLNTRKAAEALSRGDREQARSYLQASSLLLQGMRGVEGGAVGGYLAAEEAEQKELSEGMSAASTPEQVSDQIKNAKIGALKALGHTGSTF